MILATGLYINAWYVEWLRHGYCSHSDVRLVPRERNAFRRPGICSMRSMYTELQYQYSLTPPSRWGFMVIFWNFAVSSLVSFHLVVPTEYLPFIGRPLRKISATETRRSQDLTSTLVDILLFDHLHGHT